MVSNWAVLTACLEAAARNRVARGVRALDELAVGGTGLAQAGALHAAGVRAGEGSQPLAWLGTGSRNPWSPGRQPCLPRETGEGREVGERERKRPV
jgi:hypothetical protein